MPKISIGGGQNLNKCGESKHESKPKPKSKPKPEFKHFLAYFIALAKNHKFLCVFVVFYCVFLIAFSRYAPNFDDLWLWLKIIEGDSKEVYMSFRPQVGRFYPLAFLDLLALMKISTSPYLFFGFNALLFALFCAIYIKILDLSNGKSALNSLTLTFLALSSGFVIVFFGICYAEKIQVIWIALFMLCSFCVIRDLSQDSQDLRKDSRESSKIAQIIGILSLNIALFYKEPSFIAAFAFGVVLLISALCNRQKDLAKYALCVIFSALYFALLYYVLIFDEIDKTYSALTAKHILEILQEYALNDSLIVFCVGGMLLWRIYAIFVKKTRIEPFFDGLLVASFAYFGAFIALKMSAPYYLLPCYVLIIPSLIYFTRKYRRILFVKICLILGLFGFFTQNLPSGIYKAIDLKARGIQFHRTLDFVASYLRTNQNVNIYFAGISRGRDIYDFETEMRPFWFADYLEKLHNAKNFDLRTNAPNGANFHADKKSRFTLANSDIISAPKSGDLIIVSNKSIFGNSAQKAQENGELLFKSGFSSVPYIALKPLAQYISTKYFGANLTRTNFFKLPLETYIFKAY